jgi:hypothetical protein
VVQSAARTPKVVQPVTVQEAKERTVIPVYCSGDLKRRFQAACAADGIKMSAIIKKWMEEFLRLRENYDA